MGKYVDVRLIITLVVAGIVWYFVSPLIMSAGDSVETDTTGDDSTAARRR